MPIVFQKFFSHKIKTNVNNNFRKYLIQTNLRKIYNNLYDENNLKYELILPKLNQKKRL